MKPEYCWRTTMNNYELVFKVKMNITAETLWDAIEKAEEELEPISREYKLLKGEKE